MGVVEFLICAPLALVALVVVVLLALAVGRPSEGTEPSASRPINKWGVAYFIAVAIAGSLLAAALAVTGQLGRLGPLLCIFPALAIAAPFVMVALYRALRWARIL